MSSRRIVVPLLLSAGLFAETAAGVETLLVIEPTDEQPRNSEGDIIELRDGRLCLIYTRFTGGTSDHATADLAMRTSRDDGRTWSSDRIVVPREGGFNVMSVSLLRLRSGAIALFYLRKRSLTDCRPLMRVSTDEASTWSEPTVCIGGDEVGYYVLNNDRAVEHSSGRLVLPVALHNRPGQASPDWAGTIMCYLSDDAGKTWRRSEDARRGESPAGRRVMVQEPGVVELEDGRLMMFCRTDGGSQYVAWSEDRGDTWSRLVPGPLASPRSPATIERVPWSGELLCVWNDHSGAHPYSPGKRTPLCIASSRDEGRTWSLSDSIEEDPDGWYCYTAMTFQKDRVLLAYCAGDKEVGRLNRLKVVALSRDELRERSAGADARARGARTAPLERCLDYGRSFVNTRAEFNSPRFWVESRCRIVDPREKKTVEYLQCGSCKSERTFAGRDLFPEKNYDFLPVFSDEEGIVFRRHAEFTGSYRDVRPLEKWWGGTVPRLRRFEGRILTTPEEVFEAMEAGKPIVGQTELRDETTGRTAVIEYPVKTVNWHRGRKVWQVDTGPVILPDLSAPPERWSETFRLAYIAFNSPHWADFVVEAPTPIRGDGKEGKNGKAVARVYHYSEIVHRRARNVLLAWDGP